MYRETHKVHKEVFCFVLTYHKHKDERSNEAKDEIIISSEPTVRRSSVAAGIDNARDGHDQSRAGVWNGIEPLEVRLLWDWRSNHCQVQVESYIQVKTSKGVETPGEMKVRESCKQNLGVETHRERTSRRKCRGRRNVEDRQPCCMQLRSLFLSLQTQTKSPRSRCKCTGSGRWQHHCSIGKKWKWYASPFYSMMRKFFQKSAKELTLSERKTQKEATANPRQRQVTTQPTMSITFREVLGLSSGDSGTGSMSRAKLVRWLHSHSVWVAFPVTTRHPSSDHQL